MKNKNDPIFLLGKFWKIHKASATKIVLTKADNMKNPVRLWRRSLGLNQRDAAFRLRISQAQLWRIENGICIPSEALLAEMQ
jgi:predicted transcriptional regulator